MSRCAECTAINTCTKCTDNTQYSIYNYFNDNLCFSMIKADKSGCLAYCPDG